MRSLALTLPNASSLSRYTTSQRLILLSAECYKGLSERRAHGPTPCGLKTVKGRSWPQVFSVRKVGPLSLRSYPGSSVVLSLHSCRKDDETRGDALVPASPRRIHRVVQIAAPSSAYVESANCRPFGLDSYNASFSIGRGLPMWPFPILSVCGAEVLGS